MFFCAAGQHLAREIVDTKRRSESPLFILASSRVLFACGFAHLFVFWTDWSTQGRLSLRWMGLSLLSSTTSSGRNFTSNLPLLVISSGSSERLLVVPVRNLRSQQWMTRAMRLQMSNQAC